LARNVQAPDRAERAGTSGISAGLGHEEKEQHANVADRPSAAYPDSEIVKS
jgi:hypothetical protein